MAAELLVRLRRAKPPPPPPPPPSALPFKWSVRQPRSRPMMLNKKLIPRASPSTPLSWSGATSVSGVAAAAAADGSEESSQLPLNRPDATRSKVSGKNGTTNKRWGRKKKTLDELKEEEILLLGERRHLKKEIAELCVNVEKERARNESLKRLKVRFLPTLLLHTDVFYCCIQFVFAITRLVASNLHVHAINRDASTCMSMMQ
ncbi:hypothetical protein CsSME_00007346 [Camellia sinensis var. sinensis]